MKIPSSSHCQIVGRLPIGLSAMHGASAIARRLKKRGFSLIELLVVIGIIGVLMAIALPVMEKVRHRGYIDACASNLRQIGQAMHMYANENRGAFPRTIYDPAQANTPVVGNYGA